MADWREKLGKIGWLDVIAPADLPDVAIDKYPTPYVIGHDGNGHTYLYDAENKPLFHIYSWDEKDWDVFREKLRKINGGLRIFICCSKHFYDQVTKIATDLEMVGHIITFPNSFEEPLKEEEMKSDPAFHAAFKAEMFALQEKKIRENDAILVLNFDKNGQRNYIGGATFLEMFKAWELKKKIFLWNDVPRGSLRDEILGFGPVVVFKDISKIKA